MKRYVKLKLIFMVLLILSSISEAQAVWCKNKVVTPDKNSGALHWKKQKYKFLRGCKKTGSVRKTKLFWGLLTKHDIDSAYERDKIDECSASDYLMLGFKKEFTAACNIHDVCYNTIRHSQIECDSMFKLNADLTCMILYKTFHPGCHAAANIVGAGAYLANASGYDHGYETGQNSARNRKRNLQHKSDPLENKKYFSLKDNRSQRCMEIEYEHANNGTNIILGDCNDGSSQKWFYEHETGYFRSQLNPMKCLASGGVNEIGGHIMIWDCHNSDNVRFDANVRFNTKRDNVNYSINLVISAHHNNLLVIDAYGINNGADIGLWRKNGGENQLWEVIY